jgi:hypothetical protein
MDNIFTPHVVQNFLSSEECDKLSKWISINQGTPYFQSADHEGCFRQTTRGVEVKKIPFPVTAYIVRDKIFDYFYLKNFEVKYPFYHDAMIASYGFAPDECGVHKDPEYYEGFGTYHCLCLLTQPEQGGTPVLDGVEYPMNKGDLLWLPVSKVNHGTTKLVGSIPRLLWIFGFCIK